MKKQITICDFCEEEIPDGFFRTIRKFDMCDKCFYSFGWLCKNKKTDLLINATQAADEIKKLKAAADKYNNLQENNFKAAKRYKTRLENICCILRNSVTGNFRLNNKDETVIAEGDITITADTYNNLMQLADTRHLMTDEISDVML